ncbi:hypothetical protein BKA56DRAFT_651519, partial [Ilyonectria sp. MPI-CAGE-AT-0026]
IGSPPTQYQVHTAIFRPSSIIPQTGRLPPSLRIILYTLVISFSFAHIYLSWKHLQRLGNPKNKIFTSNKSETPKRIPSPNNNHHVYHVVDERPSGLEPKCYFRKSHPPTSRRHNSRVSHQSPATHIHRGLTDSCQCADARSVVRCRHITAGSRCQCVEWCHPRH